MFSQEQFSMVTGLTDFWHWNAICEEIFQQNFVPIEKGVCLNQAVCCDPKGQETGIYVINKQVAFVVKHNFHYQNWYSQSSTLLRFTLDFVHGLRQQFFLGRCQRKCGQLCGYDWKCIAVWCISINYLEALQEYMSSFCSKQAAVFERAFLMYLLGRF